MTAPTLGPILTVTIVTPDLPGALRAYEAWLGYRTKAAGAISADLAALWHAPAQAGRRYALLEPPAGGAGLRLIEGKVPSGFVPLRTHGWAAAEFLVADLDATAARIAGSPFTVIGPPRGLQGRSVLRAMQVVGPSGEVIYLTQITGDIPGFDLPRARTPVDRVFIVVLGAADLEATRAYYEHRFTVSRASDRQVAIRVLNGAFGFPEDRLHRLSSLQLAGQCAIEIDQYPPEATLRAVSGDELPPGIAMVSFAVSDAGPSARPIADAPYQGARAFLSHGAGDELIELIERR